MASSKSSPAALPRGPVIEAEWRELPPELPALPPSSLPPIAARRLRRRVAARAAARATASARRCRVCGEPARSVKVGPFAVDLCTKHSAVVNVGAIVLRGFLG